MVKDRTRIYWTKDPEEEDPPPYSDWKITFVREASSLITDEATTTGLLAGDVVEVITAAADTAAAASEGDDRLSVTYSVHKCMIGPMSEYFTRVFSSSTASDGGDGNDDGTTFIETRKKESQILFSRKLSKRSFESILSAFEGFLGYCYFDDPDVKDKMLMPHTDKDFVTNFYYSPAAVHFICDYFQITNEEFLDRAETLKRNMLDFIMDAGLNSNTIDFLSWLAEDITNFSDEGLNVNDAVGLFVGCCFEHDCFLWNDNVTKAMDLHLWLSVAKAATSPDNKASSVYTPKWSRSVARFIQENTTIVNANDFGILTKPDFLCALEPEAAVILLEEEEKRGLHEPEQSKDGGSTNQSLTDLQVRCVESFDDARLENYGSFVDDSLRQRIFDSMSRTVMAAYLQKHSSRLNKTIKQQENTIAGKEENFRREMENLNKKYNELRSMMCPILLDKAIICSHINHGTFTSQDILNFFPNDAVTLLEALIDSLSKERKILKIDYNPFYRSNTAYKLQETVIEDRAFEMLKTNLLRRREKRFDEEDFREIMEPLRIPSRDCDSILASLYGKNKIKSIRYGRHQDYELV